VRVAFARSMKGTVELDWTKSETVTAAAVEVAVVEVEAVAEVVAGVAMMMIVGVEDRGMEDGEAEAVALEVV
jgi:hypothetical protein